MFRLLISWWWYIVIHCLAILWNISMKQVVSSSLYIFLIAQFGLVFLLFFYFFFLKLWFMPIDRNKQWIGLHVHWCIQFLQVTASKVILLVFSPEKVLLKAYTCDYIRGCDWFFYHYMNYNFFSLKENQCHV